MISDEDLVLYHYRDGLEAERLSELEKAIAEDVELAARYQRLRTELETAASVFVVQEPDARFEDRLWKNLEAQLPAEPLVLRARRWFRQNTARRLIPVAALAGAVAIGVFLGRATVEPDIAVPKLTQPEITFDEDGGARVFAAYLTEHLETTERALLIAANSPDEAETARELARALIVANRLYAAAAERADRPQMVHFLRELEPVLLLLANSRLPADQEAVRDSIRRRDLPFKTRAARSAARRDFAL
jgi:hypothetical protein